MNPTEFRLTLAVLFLTELLFGLGYNWLIANSDHFPWARALTALSVVIGNTVTLALVGFFFGSAQMWLAVGIIFGAFVCSGLPMIIGYTVRYRKVVRLAEQARIEEKKARNSHMKLRWPNDMKSLRDSAAETAMAALRALNGLPETLRNDEKEKIGRAREYLTKIIALLVKAGAQVQIEDL